MMREPERYQRWIKKDWQELVEGLRLTDLQKHALCSRWIDRVVWTERHATQSRRAYYTARLIAISGGVLVPALVSLNLGGLGDALVRWLAFTASLMVALAIAIEEFFRFGNRWRHFRRTAEWLKIEGWQFLQLAGDYRHKTHAEAYPLFARRIEGVIHEDVDTFLTHVAYDRRDPGAQHGTKTEDSEQPGPEGRAEPAPT
jgi:hypothetical protein